MIITPQHSIHTHFSVCLISSSPSLLSFSPSASKAAPDITKQDAAEEKIVGASRALIRGGFGRALKDEELDDDADALLVWLVRYPCEV